jgi:hypothetical protein
VLVAFRVTGLDPAPLRPWFSLSDAELAARRALRTVADSTPGYPCRISLDDAEVGEELILLPYEHHPVDSPYRAAGPVYVRAGADRPFDAVDVVPPALTRRLLSVRAWDPAGMLRRAEVCPGRELDERVREMLEDPATRCLHVHAAGPGCFLARVERA